MPLSQYTKHALLCLYAQVVLMLWEWKAIVLIAWFLLGLEVELINSLLRNTVVMANTVPGYLNEEKVYEKELAIMTYDLESFNNGHVYV